MVFPEVSVIEVREALRAWLAGKSERAVAAQASLACPLFQHLSSRPRWRPVRLSC
jgi:hypothetical protein